MSWGGSATRIDHQKSGIFDYYLSFSSIPLRPDGSVERLGGGCTAAAQLGQPEAQQALQALEALGDAGGLEQALPLRGLEGEEVGERIDEADVVRAAVNRYRRGRPLPICPETEVFSA